MTKWGEPKDNQGYVFTQWKCPECGYEHDKPHHLTDKVSDIINTEKEVGQKGRIKGAHNAEDISQVTCTTSSPHSDKKNGMYCPTCGWYDDVVLITKIPVPCANDLECVIKNCTTDPVKYDRKTKMAMCRPHLIELGIDASRWQRVESD